MNELSGSCVSNVLDDDSRHTGTGDELSALAFDRFRQRVRRVGVHGRAIDKQFALHVSLDGRLDRGFDGLVVADTGEDDVRYGDGLFDGRDDGGFAGGEFGGEVCRALLGAVVDYEGGGELGFLDEILAHALS